MCGKLLYINALLLAALVTGAAAGNDVDEQIWADYHEHFYLKPNWEFYGDGGYRMVLETHDWQKLYVRPSLRFHAPRFPVEGRGGVGFFYTDNQTTANQLELRPWLGTLVKWPRFKRLSITNYFRLEARLMWYTGGVDFDASLRFRYKLGAKIPLNWDAVEKYAYVPISIEWFADVGPAVGDVYAADQRYSAGVGYVFNYVWVGEFQCVLQKSRSGADLSYESNDLIFRISIKHLWSAYDYMGRDD